LKSPPAVKQLVFGRNMQNYKRFSFKINDNVATSPNVEPLSYEARVDGQWVLMEYDKKNGTIAHTFDGVIQPGDIEFRLVVRNAIPPLVQRSRRAWFHNAPQRGQ
jgi:hypothetical protein